MFFSMILWLLSRMINKNKNGRNKGSRSVDNLENKNKDIANLKITKNTFFEGEYSEILS